jgi:hypothetical protein
VYDNVCKLLFHLYLYCHVFAVSVYPQLKLIQKFNINILKGRGCTVQWLVPGTENLIYSFDNNSSTVCHKRTPVCKERLENPFPVSEGEPFDKKH